jgi:hypothetical protein
MNCEEFWNTAPARELNGAHAAHLRDCASCAGQWEAEATLSAGLRAMAEASKTAAAPARVEFRLVQAFRRQNGTVRRLPVPTARQPWLAALGWTAAAAAMAIALLLVRSPQPQPANPGRAHLIQLANSSSIEEATYSDTASESDSEEGDVVRLEVPRSAMIALGYDVSPERAAERVEAEVTLGPDGQARAVRFLEE